MADYILYDYTAITEALKDIEKKTGLLNAQADEIRTEQKKFDNAWKDPQSATAYQAVQTRWNHSFDDITMLLARVKEAAKEAVVAMQQTNHNAAQTWSV